MMKDAASSDPRLGVTIFSFTREYLSREWSLADCANAVASLGPDQYLEILDAEHVSSYPHLSTEAERSFREAVDESGVLLSMYGHEVEYGWVAGHPFDDERIVEVVIGAMEIAARLGFPLFRANMPRPELLEKLLPSAERLGLQLLVELHSQTIESPEVQALVSAFDRWQSPNVGLLQDLGSFTMEVPRAFLRYKAHTGVPGDLLQVIDDGYRAGRPKRDVVEEVRSLGGDALAVETANECFAMFVKTAPSTIAQLGHYLRHVHTKFYEIVDGEEPCIPYPEIVGELKKLDYTGVLSTEWSGFNFIEEPVGLEQVRAQQEMLTRLWRGTTRSSVA